jgi:type IV secretory pathway protease TraF
MPLYYLEGAVKGFISFSFYQLKMGDMLLKLPELERAISLSIPISLNSLFLLLLGLSSIAYWIYRKHSPVLARLMFPTSMATVFSTTIFYMTYTVYILKVVESLAGEYVVTSSAGILILGQVILESSPLADMMISPLPFLSISILNAVLSTMWILRIYTKLSSQGTK